MKYVLAVLAAIVPLQVSNANERTVRDGVYSEAQASEGRTLYEKTCALGCHIDNLMGSGPTPNLRGDDFLLRWTDFSLAELLELMRTTMPKDQDLRLSDEEYISVAAYILSVNGFPAGDAALPPDDSALDQIFITDAP